jgi:hypothetical protein
MRIVINTWKKAGNEKDRIAAANQGLYPMTPLMTPEI